MSRLGDQVSAARSRNPKAHILALLTEEHGRGTTFARWRLAEEIETIEAQLTVEGAIDWRDLHAGRCRQ
jgi:hypothetical protein